MQEVGGIVEGKVTGITKFGAFVELEGGEVGMVHISEVSQSYVNDISEHLKEGQTVKVKVLSVNDDGKIALSIKKAIPQPERRDNNGAPQQGSRFNKPRPQGNGFPPKKKEGVTAQPKPQFTENASSLPKGPANFEDMLSKFMSSSEDKFAGTGMKKQTSSRRGAKRPHRDDD